MPAIVSGLQLQSMFSGLEMKIKFFWSRNENEN